MPLSLLALAISTFGFGTAECVIMGLMPNVASDMGISIPSAGYLVSAYAIGVVIGAPLLAALGTRIPRKGMMLTLILLFMFGNLASALAPSFGMLIASRVLAGLPHGAFFGLAAVVATRLVHKDRQASAVAVMFMGLTVANVVGVPAGTAIGQQFGWRPVFFIITVIGLFAVASLAVLIPRVPHVAREGFGSELRAFTNRQVLLGLLTAVFGFGGVFTVFSYVGSMTTRVTGLSESSTPWVLALFGIGMTLGGMVAGPLTDRALRPTLYGALAALALSLLLFTFAVQVTWAALTMVIVLGAVGFGTVTPIQMLVMTYAQSAPTLASASNQSAFNLANAGGAWLGGMVVAAGFGWRSPALAGALLTALGLAVALLAGFLDRDRTGSIYRVAAQSRHVEAAAEAVP